MLDNLPHHQVDTTEDEEFVRLNWSSANILRRLKWKGVTLVLYRIRWKDFWRKEPKGATGGLSQVLQCQADVARNLECLNLAGIANEAEVRFAIVDPIVGMVCEKWNLEVYFM